MVGPRRITQGRVVEQIAGQRVGTRNGTSRKNADPRGRLGVAHTAGKDDSLGVDKFPEAAGADRTLAGTSPNLDGEPVRGPKPAEPIRALHHEDGVGFDVEIEAGADEKANLDVMLPP